VNTITSADTTRKTCSKIAAVLLSRVRDLDFGARNQARSSEFLSASVVTGALESPIHSPLDPPRELFMKPLLIAWALAAAVGVCLSMEYASAPSATADAQSLWPAESTIRRSTTAPTLLVFLHPKCPCSRATLAELRVLLSKCVERPQLRIVVVRPSGAPVGWERGELWDMAAAIPGAIVSVDPDCREADRFHARTSGEVLLYGAQGALAYHGGLTWARGHEGESVGRDSLESIINSGRADNVQTPVYGCALKNE
jgi:hypothetical protein